MRWLIDLPVMFYRKCISPLLPNVCKYTPSCSQYMLDAVREYGPVKGAAKGICRLARCNPFSKGGYDPVPINPKGEVKWLY